MASQPLLQYKSLDDIRARKQVLRQELQADSLSMKTQWNGLFHKPKNQTPSRRLTTFMTTGASLFDGVLLAMKLYYRFGGHRKTAKKKGLLARLFL